MITQFLRHLFEVLRMSVPELAAALWRLLLLLLLLLLHLLRALWELLLRLFKGHEGRDESKPPMCDKVPEQVKRKPDPCLYSQFYLSALGLAVTWDNPDMWVTLPNGTPVDSGSLVANTDYILHVRIHDASFDPALATEVRCFYRPWSFNHPDRTPVEVNADGTERVVVLHIPPWSSEVAQFRWHTPDIAEAHFCIQAECRHPDDKNPNNNLGQENTNVRRASPGQMLAVNAFLRNQARETGEFQIRVDNYVIPEGEVTLGLKTARLPLRMAHPFDLLHRAMLTYDVAARSLKGQEAYAPQVVRYAYTGWDPVRKGNRVGRAPVLPPWRVEVDGREVEGGRGTVRLAAGEGRNVPLSVTIPAGVQPGSRHVFNWSAFGPRGKPMGGVTLIIVV